VLARAFGLFDAVCRVKHIAPDRVKRLEADGAKGHQDSIAGRRGHDARSCHAVSWKSGKAGAQSPESNNSAGLTELARRLGRPAYQVNTAADLRPEWFADACTIGLTAGTSTPDDVIEEVRRWLEEYRPL
jgi:hypothetical protein